MDECKKMTVEHVACLHQGVYEEQWFSMDLACFPC